MDSVDAVPGETFRELVEALRPDLHRYCARMTGSVADGEDVVQEVLLRAHASLGEVTHVSQSRAWLFRIAHNRAIDHTRSYRHRMAEPLEAIEGRDEERDSATAADDRLAAREVYLAAITHFSVLPPIQRSCVILKDVLDHSLEEIAELLETSVSAVQAALHRGRTRLQRQRHDTAGAAAPLRSVTPAFARYAELFDARDWDGVRAMLAEEVRLDVVDRFRRSGRGEVGRYFTNYGKIEGWRAVPGWLDGRQALAIIEGAATTPRYFVDVQTVGDRVTSIRDFRHVPYIARDAVFEAA